MNAGLGGGAAHDTDCLAWALARARVSLSALAAHRQAAEMADTPVAADTLQPFQVHADFAAQIAFDHIFAVLNFLNETLISLSKFNQLQIK